MTKLKLISLLAGGMLTISSIAPIFAQTAVDAQLLDTVKAAFASTQAVSSMTVTVASRTDITGQAESAPMQQSTQNYLVALTDAGWNVAATQTTSTSMPAGDSGAVAAPATTTLEYVTVGGTTYVRFTQLPEMMAEQGLPQDWTDVAQLAQMPGGGMFAGIAADGALPAAVIGPLSLPIDAASVTALAEIQADVIEGQNMRVFQLALDPAAVASSSAASLLTTRSGGAGFGPGGPGGGAGPQPGGESGQPPAAGPEGTPPADFQPPARSFTAENTQVTITVWVGDDNLVHRVSSAITTIPTGDAANGPMAAGSTTTTTSDYSGFNQPVEIVAPLA